ncbi:FAD-binding oxidoreductase [Aliiroseovarius sp.]|uniref:FAD-binding oxidoreductase n=1 Tax=Aliiroseovarius sp. TaxID=1872442 RepID=UPI002602896D|nr:FAD-binding oxidoreductase [Aliiroseovarius sp.]
MRWNTVECTGWGRVHRATSQVARPERLSTLSATLADTPAPGVGNRRSYGDACLNGDGHAVDMTRMDRILSFDRQTGVLEAEAGLTIGALAHVTAPQGWLPAVMPGTGRATLGGCAAMDVHGKNHHVAGSFGQHVLSVTLMQGDRRVVATPNRNKSLFRATMGGLGQTGVIAQLKLQLKPCPGTVLEVRERRIECFEDFIRALDGSQADYVVGWIDAAATGAHLGRGVLEEAQLTRGDTPPRSHSRKVPMDAPGFALSPPVVRLFNAAYYGRIPPGEGRARTRRIDDFFFPLDKIHDWNRLYGKRGFHQFQCVVPLDQVAALREILVEIAEAHLASPLAVLKRLGPGRAGHMSFPMEGYTLAVDFPARDGIEALIDQLEQLCRQAGGRLYLAKDALAHGEAIKAMYSEHGDWVAETAKADPDGAYETDMTRRLTLRSAR